MHRRLQQPQPQPPQPQPQPQRRWLQLPAAARLCSRFFERVAADPATYAAHLTKPMADEALYDEFGECVPMPPPAMQRCRVQNA